MPANLIRGDGNATRPLSLFETLTAVGKTDSARFRGDVVVQATGPATAVTFLLERHPPLEGDAKPATNSTAWGQADVATTGNPSTGLAAALFQGRGDAWLRINLTAKTGGDVSFSITGEG